VTHLRKLMLDELRRRNYSQNTVRFYIHAVGILRSTFAVRRTASVQTTSANTRFTYFVIANSRRAPSKVALPLCVFSSSRRSGDRIFPITFRFRSVRGGCPRY